MDDGFLTVASACLCAGTAILYERIQIIYLEFAILQKNPIALQIAREEMDDIQDQSKWQHVVVEKRLRVGQVKRPHHERTTDRKT